MTDNVRAGMNYEFRVVSNADEFLDNFETRIKRLKAEAATLGKSVNQQRGASARLTAERKALNSLQKRLKIQTRLNTVYKRQTTSALAQLKVLRLQQKAAVDRTVIDNRILRAGQIQADVENRQNATLRKRLRILAEIKQAQLTGARSIRDIAEQTGLTPNQLAKGSDYWAGRVKAERELAAEQRKTQQQQKAASDKRRKAQEQDLAARQKINDFAKRHNVTSAQAAERLGVTAQRAKQLGIEMQKSASAANNFLFTFRRLVGILAIFTLARKFAESIGQAVREMSRFNSVLEDSKLSLASLIAATGDIVDDQGKLLKGREELNAALKITDDLTMQIRKDALQTTATYEDLLGAFQVAVGPGLSAGLGLEEVRETAINIAKAAAALRVPTNQLSEEIRSLIQGTIRLNNTRLAAIGVSNVEIRAAKERGELFEYLAGKLEAFSESAELVAQTFTGLQSQVKDAASSLLAEGSVEYFEELKAAMTSFVNALVQQEKIGQGDFGLNETAVSSIQEVSGGLGQLISDFRELFTAEEALNTMWGILTSIGTSIKIISGVLTPVVVGFIKAVGVVASLFAVVGKVVIAVRDLLPDPIVKGFGKLVSIFTAIVTTAFLWVKTIALVGGIYKAIIGSKFILNTLEAVGNVLAGIKLQLQVAITTATTRTAAVVAVINILTGAWQAILIAVLSIIGFIFLGMKGMSALTEKITGDMGDTAKSAEDIATGVTDGTKAVLAQSEAVKALQEDFEKLLEDIKKAQNQYTKTVLLQGVEGDAGDYITTLVNGMLRYSKQLNLVQIEIDGIRKSLAEVAEVEKEFITTNTLDDFRFKVEGSGATTASQFMDNFMKEVNDIPIIIIPKYDPTIPDDEQLSQHQQQIIANEEKLSAATRERLRLRTELNQTIQQQQDYIKETITLTETELKQAAIRLDAREDDLYILQRQGDQIKSITNSIGGGFSESAAKALLLANQVEQISAKIQVAQGDLEHFRLRREEDLANLVSQLGSESQATADAVFDLNEQRIEARIKALAAERERLSRELKIEVSVASGDLLGSFEGGLLRWSDSVDTFAESFLQMGQQIPQQFSESLADLLSGGLLGEEVSAEEVGAQFLADVARQMMQTLVANLVNVILSNTLLKSALAGLAAVVGAETAARVTEAAAQTTAMLANTAAVLANTAILTTRTALGLNKGGGIKGYKAGGHVASNFPKPSYIDPRDTVQAWLTPGEHVMTTGATKLLGHGFFDNINALARGNRAASMRLASHKSMSPIIGRAEGGSVPGSSVGVRTDTGSGVSPVLPVLVADEVTAEEIFAGGRDAFALQMNESSRAGDLNRSGF